MSQFFYKQSEQEKRQETLETSPFRPNQYYHEQSHNLLYLLRQLRPNMAILGSCITIVIMEKSFQRAKNGSKSYNFDYPFLQRGRGLVGVFRSEGALRWKAARLEINYKGLQEQAFPKRNVIQPILKALGKRGQQCNSLHWIKSIQVQISITDRVRGVLFRNATTFQLKQKKTPLKLINDYTLLFNQTPKYLSANYVTVQNVILSLVVTMEAYHRNKCQKCFSNLGRYLFDCWCILCEDCKHRQKSNLSHCKLCRKPTKGMYFDMRDKNNSRKVDSLFCNVDLALSTCISTYRYQSSIDLRYIAHLENQLEKYKDLLTHIINENPRLNNFVRAFFQKKDSHHRSVSEQLQYRERKDTPHRPRGSSSVQERHNRIVEPVHVKQRERNYSGKVSYKVPNINYSTALRSSKRPTSGSDLESQDVVYYQRR